jgi:uncharacterized Zn finger protein (UPF0148 family)
MQAIAYELKYCERCGSLRLRRADAGDTYCQPCERVLFNVPQPEALQLKALRRRPQTAKSESPGIFQTEAQLALPYGRLQ